MVGFEIFIDSQAVENTEQTLPLFKEMSINFETGEPVIKENEIIILEGIEALKVWVWKVLKTERNKYVVYSDSYGNDLRNNIGQIYDETIRRAVIQNEIINCLMVNPYITNVNNFQVELDIEKRYPIFSFSVSTIYGEITNQEVDIFGN